MTSITKPWFVSEANARSHNLALLWALALASSCALADPEQPSDVPSASGGASAGSVATGGSAPTGGSVATGGSAGSPHLNPLGRARCRAPEGVSASPQDTEQAVELLNALPKPTGAACFVESLARPLMVYATNSVFSAQPALSTKSPRVFIKLGQLWLSIVIDGDSSYLLELSTLVGNDPSRSIKGELLLPIDEPIPKSAPYERIRRGAGTVCGFCHYAEEIDTSISFTAAFASVAFRPRPDTRVSIDELRDQAQLCDWQVESHRCEMLSAVFGGGAVVEAPFPDGMPTFF